MNTVAEKTAFQARGPKTDHSTLLAKQEKRLLIKEIDPLRCRPWKFHNRDLAWLTPERCQDLISSIQKQGQMEPALVRDLKADLHYDFEIIFGVRRWFACSQIPHQKLLARITDADDQSCALFMHSENADSQDITQFEKAFSLAQQLKSGIFKSQTEMADRMGITQGYVSKLIQAGEIFEYPWIRNLFPNKLGISVKYAYRLSTLLRNPQEYARIEKEAHALLLEKESKGKLWASKEILKKLISARQSKAFLSKSTLLQRGDKSIIACRRAQSGRFSLFIEPEAKQLPLLELQKTCMQAITDFLAENTPLEKTQH